MKIQIRSYNHAVGEFNYHIQITPAYRREVMENEKVEKLVKSVHIADQQSLSVALLLR